MPLIRIDVPEGVSTDIKKQIHSKVREVVLKTLAPKEVKYAVSYTHLTLPTKVRV